MKLLRYFIYISVISLLLMAGIAFLKVNEGLRFIINTKGAETLGVKVSVDGINLKIFEGKVEVTGLRVANPAGFSANDAAYIPKITAKFNIRGLLNKPILIKEINLHDPILRFEVIKGKNNLSSLRGNITPTAPSLASPGTEQVSTEEKMQLAVEFLTINNIKLHADLGMISRDINLGNITINGTKNNMPIPYNRVIAAALENVISQTLKNPEIKAQIFGDFDILQSPKELRKMVKSAAINHLKGQFNKLFK